MASCSIVYGMEDGFNHKSYSGFTFSDPGATTPSMVEAFGTVIQTYSDAVLVHASVKNTIDIPVSSPIPAGTNIERRGVVVIKDLDGGRRFNVSIPAVKTSAIEPNGSAQSGLTEACESAVLSAWATITGRTGKVVASYSDGSQFQR